VAAGEQLEEIREVLEKLRRCLAGRIDPAAAARLVKEDREER
jgi:hypothetical protein